MSNIDNITIQRNAAEMPLFVLSLLFSLPVIMFMVISVIGLAYALLFIAITYVGHIAAVSHIRGSGLHVSEDQFPEIYQAVAENAKRIGMQKIPEVYVVQGNGMLNAMASKFVFTKLLVIYSNLVEACEDEPGVRSMIIGHELGHLHAGHLSWRWLIWPSYFIPFLSNALSRAREYTADRYGLACAGNQQDAIKGLMILASGKQLASRVSIESFVSQRRLLNTGFMRLGEWLRTHPVLVRRVCALDKNMDKMGRDQGYVVGSVRAASMVLVVWTMIVCFYVGMYEFGKDNVAKAQRMQPTLACQHQNDDERRRMIVGSWVETEIFTPEGSNGKQYVERETFRKDGTFSDRLVNKADHKDVYWKFEGVWSIKNGKLIQMMKRIDKLPSSVNILPGDTLTTKMLCLTTKRFEYRANDGAVLSAIRVGV